MDANTAKTNLRCTTSLVPFLLYLTWKRDVQQEYIDWSDRRQAKEMRVATGYNRRQSKQKRRFQSDAKFPLSGSRNNSSLLELSKKFVIRRFQKARNIPSL